ncbi:MAG: glycosyltransferase family 4 protein [Candidatus Yanofskybacteria bacterium]|nr:glycosyltransferase family 4 protein [Candidatus Yanofskybacteria bacterium]
MKTQRVLIVTGIFPPDIGGPASYAKTVGQKLSENFRISVITYSSVRKSVEDKNLNFKVVRVWRKNFWLFRHLSYFFKVMSLAGKNDVVFSLSTINGGITGLIAAKFFKKKFFIRIVGDYAWQTAVLKGRTDLLIDDFQNSKKNGRVKMLFWLQSLICRKADMVIVPSEYISRLVQGWGVPKEKIQVIYNGASFKPSELSKEEARKKIGIAGNIILSYGRLVPWKGFRMLIKIMPKLLEINQFFRLVIVGEGPESKILQRMVKNMGLEKKVYLIGKQSKEQLAVYLAASDIFILNTGYEGFSHEILEAMLAGVPVVTTCVGGNKEIIHQGENGFLVKYNDEFNLIEATKTVWQTPELQKRFIENGKETAKYFSVEKMLDKTIRVLAN